MKQRSNDKMTVTKVSSWPKAITDQRVCLY